MLTIGIIFIGVVGTLLHFTYELSSHNKLVAIFSAVNESTWEHIKIGMTPTFLWSLYDGFIYGSNSNYLIGKALSLLTIILLIPLLFYTYTTFTKKSILVVDIISFMITVVASNFVFNYFIKMDALPFLYTYLSSILLFLEIAAYVFLTFNPIKNFLFEDPISHDYGLSGHTEMHHHDHK